MEQGATVQAACPPAEITRKGLVVGPKELLAYLPHSSGKVRCWAGCSAYPRAQIEQTLRKAGKVGVQQRTSFDAAHGRRFFLFLYRSHDELQACRDFVCSQANWG